MRRPSAAAPSSARRVGLAALLSLSAGLVVLVVGQGFSSIGVVRALEDIALGVIVAAVLMGSVAFVAVRLAGWRDLQYCGRDICLQFPLVGAKSRRVDAARVYLSRWRLGIPSELELLGEGKAV